MATPAPRLRFVRPAVAGGEIVAPRTRWSIFATVLIAVVSVAVTLVSAAPARAEPTVAEIEKQIDDAWHKIEPVIEKHNATREDLAAKKKQANALGKKIAPLQLQVDLAMNKVGVLAVRAYKGDQVSALNTMLGSEAAEGLIDRLALMDQFARRQQEEIRVVLELKDEYAAKKAPLDRLVAQLTETEAELAKKKKEIDAEIKRLQKLRLQAYGTGGGLGELRPAPCPATYLGGDIGAVVKFACAQIGKPYVWGSAGPNSYDCSGLMLRAWEKAGVRLPHNAARQRSVTAVVSRADLRPGDLVFYNGLAHVGMYVGDGWIVHAPTSGDRVRMRKLDVGTIHSFGRPG